MCGITHLMHPAALPVNEIESVHLRAPGLRVGDHKGQIIADDLEEDARVPERIWVVGDVYDLLYGGWMWLSSGETKEMDSIRQRGGGGISDSSPKERRGRQALS